MSMKKVVYTKYGSPKVLKMTEVEKPIPTENEILVKVYATSVTATECTFRRGEPYFSRLFTGLAKPKITTLGEELSGVVEAIGRNISKFKIGDEIFGTAGPTFGANVEYICLPETGVLSLKPTNRTFLESAANVDGFLTALPFLRDTGKIKKGQNILIYGASGSIGTAAIQLAKYYDATVTGVCSTTNKKLIMSLGADAVIDYTKKDFTQNGETYDIIFDTVGKTTFPTCKNSLKPKGVFLESGIQIGVMFQVLWTAMFDGKKAKIAATGLRPEAERLKDLLLLKKLMENGTIKSVIDKTYSLDNISDAHEYVDKGHKKGNVAIKVN